MKKEYNQQPGEDYQDWKYRLILGKARGDLDLTWDELAEFLDVGFCGETLRKQGKGILEFQEQLQVRRTSAALDAKQQDAYEKLENKRVEEEKERMRLQDQRRVYRADIREQARREYLEAAIVEAIKERPAPKINVPETLKVNDASEKEGVLLLSDWHKGLVTDNHWNVFNDAVFNKRIQTLLEKTIRYGKEHEIKALNIFVLGDMINGLIHITTRINNSDNVVKQTIDVAKTLTLFIKTVSEVFPKVRVWFSRGNHDRITPDMKESLTPESFFDLLQFIVGISLGDPKNVELIENDLDDEIIRAEVCGKTILAVHGHKDRPAVAYKNLSTFTRIFPDYIFAGHFHSSAELENNDCEVVINGSLCGTDDFAVKLRRHGKPSQKFMIFTPEEGRLCTYNFSL